MAIGGNRYCRNWRIYRASRWRAGCPCVQCAVGFAGVTAKALAPLIAKELLGGNASTFGILPGAVCVGAVIGALLINTFRAHVGTEKACSSLAMLRGIALITVGFNRSLPLTCLSMLLAGAAYSRCRRTGKVL